jgi:hypothetical protein
LLQQIEPGQGARDGKRGVGGHTPFTREDAARDAGMSKHQQMQATRTANVPDADFEAMIESDNPPTISQHVAGAPFYITYLSRSAFVKLPTWC